MDMHELEQAWQGFGQQLQQQAQALRQQQRQRGIDGLRARLRLVSLGLWSQLGIAVLIVLWAGNYWFTHRAETHLLVYGLTLHLYGLALLLAAAWQLTRLAQVDYHRPILELQAGLLALRRLRVHCERALLLVGCLIWLPLLLIALRALGIDVWLQRPSVVLWNGAAALGLCAMVAWLLQRYRDWFERDASGRSLRQAEAELAELRVGGDERA